MQQRILAVFLLLALVSCSASIPYSTDYPLTEQTFHSRDGIFSGKVPQGWFASVDDTSGISLIVWLLQEDLSTAITIKELKLDRLTSQRVKKEGLELLANISAGFQFENHPRVDINTQEFTIGSKTFCSYEIASGNGLKRIVVFSVKGKYYECEAQVLKIGMNHNDIIRSFNAQQTVLSSLIY